MDTNLTVSFSFVPKITRFFCARVPGESGTWAGISTQSYEPFEISVFQITVEDYVLALQVLTNDVRFTLYNVLYKRILLLWMMLGFFILLGLLFSGQSQSNVVLFCVTPIMYRSQNKNWIAQDVFSRRTKRGSSRIGLPSFGRISGTKGLALFGGGVFWLIVNATGIFVCMWLKFKVRRRSLAGTILDAYEAEVHLWRWK